MNVVRWVFDSRSLRLLVLLMIACALATSIRLTPRGWSDAVHADDLPSWLRAAATLNVPDYPKEVPAVVLVDESAVTVEDDGRVVKNNFYAIKVLNREGRDEAVAVAVFNTDHEKVREMR